MIVVFGSINVDLAARVTSLPQRGETVTGHSLSLSPGGKGANQALAARRAGAEVALVGAVGRDTFAGPALALLRQAGIDLSRVAAVDAPTGTALIQVDAAGDNTITVVAGANAYARAEQADDGLLQDASLLLLQLEARAEESLALARRARQSRVRVALNAAPAAPLDPAWLHALDVLVVNEGEAATLAPAFGVSAEVEAFAAEVARRHAIDVVVTRGSEGAFAASQGRAFRVPAWSVAVVDTVGAGDAFAGALAAALDRREPLPRALACASVAGALACTGQGAQAALPTLEAIGRHVASIESAIVIATLPP